MKKEWLRLLMVGVFAFCLVLAGCEGDDGRDGVDGVDGDPGPPGTGLSLQANETCIVCHAENRIADVAEFHGLNSSELIEPVASNLSLADAGGFPELSFHIEDGNGTPISNLGEYELRIYMAQLIPGTLGDADTWDRWAYERNSTDYPFGTLDTTNAADGDYVYTFATPFSDSPDADNVQRIALRARIRNVTTAENAFYDFLIADPGTEVLSGKDTVSTAACNQCHDQYIGNVGHGGGYNETMMCVMCHNPNYLDPAENGMVEGDFVYMIHRIHAGLDFTELNRGDPISFEEVTYPQSLANCATCHAGVDADNWNTRPTMVACGSCHEDVDFTSHGGGQVDNQDCSTCHSPVDISAYHATPNATANNPDLLPNQREIIYALSGASITGGNLTINFSIFSDGTLLDLTDLPADLLAGDRWPGFLMAWAEEQDGIAAPADYNNLGNSAGQPTSISLEDLADGSIGTLTCDAGGCVATMADPFPAGAMMRTIGLQGYFRQDLDGDGEYDESLHTQSDVVTVEGDDARREVVDSAGCAACHEIFEGHGGNRVFTANGGVAICTLCHVPNLSSSGRSIDPAAAEARPSDAYLALGLPTTDWPEATNNFKDMIHGIHSAMSDVRTEEYEFVRGRNDGIYYNWSEVTYPGTLNNCEKCHLDDTFRPEEVPAGALVTTDVTTSGAPDETFADVDAARDSLPNATDLVISPLGAACYSCHTAEAVVDHMKLNGAAFGERADVVGDE
ncbi:MAG: OmcA/MtrC family decaheme c-type cytochrome [Desulfuromonadales bacterium]|nr:OmcA/MtrC family decaheme c-type cytochrome [Desulfuromonadales bacterium]